MGSKTIKKKLFRTTSFFLPIIVVKLVLAVGLPGTAKALPAGFGTISHNNIPMLHDYSSGLTWMNFITPGDMSLSDIIAYLTNEASYAYGFRTAKTGEFEDLLYHYFGHPSPYEVYIPPSADASEATSMHELIYRLGISWNWSDPDGARAESAGYFIDYTGEGGSPQKSAHSWLTWRRFTNTGYEITYGHAPIDPSWSPPSSLVSYGVWLVCEEATIPEPSILLLLICGVIGPTGFSLKKKRK